MILERLKTILSHFNLTPSSFADATGVPRSSISHLLSGRNKPSLDFILKLVHEFPEVDLYWLLFGKGVFPPSKETPIEVHGTNEPLWIQYRVPRPLPYRIMRRYQRLSSSIRMVPSKPTGQKNRITFALCERFFHAFLL